MKADVFTYIVGGKAGEGVKKAGTTAANAFSSTGRHVFQMDDYPSLIRGGHNFVVVSTSTRAVLSHYMGADLVVALDERSYGIHRSHVADGGVMVYNSDVVQNGKGVGVPMTTEAEKYPDAALRIGVSGIAALSAAIGQSPAELAALIKREYKRDLENNIAFASAIYEHVQSSIGGRFTLPPSSGERHMFTGNQAIALGAAAAGLDMYIGYPMTPASTVLHYLAAHDKDLGVTVVHPESELAVANMAIGAAAAGARVMVGTSGGGFGLMEEAFSFAGMAEAPLLCVLSSRPGPSTGVPTYTEQADLRFALNQGHGDFPRLVASPGTVGEAFTLAAEMLAMVWTYQTPGILLTEKHLSESRVTVDIDVASAAWAEPVAWAESAARAEPAARHEPVPPAAARADSAARAESAGHDSEGYRRYSNTADGVSPLLFPPSAESIKWSSYEHDEAGITTEEGDAIVAMHDKRDRKAASLAQHLRGVRTVNRFGDDGPVILTYGSTTMSVIEALIAGGIRARVVQPVYLEPFPVWEFEDLRDESVIVVEQSSTGQFATLMAERAGVRASSVITRYDGRPFEPRELARDIQGATT